MMNEQEIYFTALVNKLPNTELGQMFGKKCGKINGKAFVTFF